MAVFCTDVQVGSFAEGEGSFQIGERHAENNLAGSVLDHRSQLGNQRFCGFAVVVHLPVSSHNGFAECLIHVKILPF